MEGDDNILIIGLVPNTQKKEAFSVVKKVVNILKKRKIDYLIEAEAALLMGEEKKATYQQLRDRVSMVIIFGGDGTFLHTAHYFFGSDIPLLGVNIGRLGFLTEIEINELEKALDYLIEGKYKIERRMILKANILHKGELVYTNHALNDFVINRGANSRMANIELYINNEIVNTYRADGIIVATPTGSTAYSLSAGGPIVNPQIRAIIITPICPHSLFIRPMVIFDKEELKIVVRSDDLMLTADGRYAQVLVSGDQILLSASKKEISIVKLPERTFYTILHKKMKVGLI